MSVRTRYPLVRTRKTMVQVVRGIASLAAIVGATGAQAAPTSNAIAPPHEARLAPASSTFAPAGRAIAPSSVSLAPTSEAQIARASGPPGFDAARAWAHLQKQVSFGPRPSGSAALKQCRDYIIAELKKVGLDAREQAFVARTPAGDIPMINLVATIPGRRAERVILASHY